MALRRDFWLCVCVPFLWVSCVGQQDDEWPSNSIAFDVIHSTEAWLSVAGNEGSTLVVGGQPGQGAFSFVGDGGAVEPQRLDGAGMLWWVTGLESGKGFVAVGEQGSVFHVAEDGQGKRLRDPEESVTLYGVFGPNLGTLWVVGTREGQEGPEPVFERYDGSSWETVEWDWSGDGPPPAAFYKISGVGDHPSMVVGNDGVGVARTSEGEWRGSRVTDTGSILFSVHCASPRRCAAVGGIPVPIVLLWDDEGWSDVPLPSNRPPVLQGVHMDADGGILVSGFNGFLGRIAEGSDAIASYETGTNHAIHSVWVDGDGKILLTGGNIETARLEYEGFVGLSVP